jgi:FMN reductase
MLAIDYALRPILSVLGARHVLPGIYATDTQVRWSDQLGLELDRGIDSRIAEGVQALCDALGARAALRAAAPSQPLQCGA